MRRKRPLSDREFRDIYSRVTRLTVEVVAVDERGQVLLSRRSAGGWAGKWQVPGGTVLYREGVLGALSRVAREELGVEVKVVRGLGYIEWWSEQGERGFGYSVSLPFLCGIGEKRELLSADGEELRWFGKLPNGVIDEHRRLLEKDLGFESADGGK